MPVFMKAQTVNRQEDIFLFPLPSSPSLAISVRHSLDNIPSNLLNLWIEVFRMLMLQALYLQYLSPAF